LYRELYSTLFPVITNMGVLFSSAILFLIASAVWGVYFEFLSFTQQEFIVTNESRENYSRDWSTISIFWGIGMLVGPIIGSLLIHENLLNSTVIIVTLQLVALLFVYLLTKRVKKKNIEQKEIKEHVSIVTEFRYWLILLKKIWPVILVGLTWEFVSATFWTIGGLYGETLLGDFGLDWMVMFMFILPILPGALILGKLKIVTKKKYWSEITLMLGGLLLALIYFTGGNILAVLVLILLAGFFLALSWPLNEAVYSDLIERSGDNQLHLTSITRANVSIGYTLGPILAGFLSDSVGYGNTLAIFGTGTAIVAFILLFVTPRKLRLPQKELKHVTDSDL
jgi:MFS family permease